MLRRTVIPVALAASVAALPLSSGCGPGRTAAATQPTPSAFDPAQSDQRAVEVVDAMLAELGGADLWESGAKQIRWDLKYYRDDELALYLKHAWDRWNGRHRAELIDLPSYRAAIAEGRPEATKSAVAMYDLFDRSSGTVMFDGQQLPSAEQQTWVERAYERWQEDSYRLAMHYKLKDPGVKLEHAGEVADVEGKCTPACDLIKVTFDPAVGEDTFYVSINTDTRVLEIQEKLVEDDKRVGYGVSEWVEAEGLKFPTRFQNLGLEGEHMEIENVQVGDPDDRLYIPQVR